MKEIKKEDCVIVREFFDPYIHQDAVGNFPTYDILVKKNKNGEYISLLSGVVKKINNVSLANRMPIDELSKEEPSEVYKNFFYTIYDKNGSMLNTFVRTIKMPYLVEVIEGGRQIVTNKQTEILRNLTKSPTLNADKLSQLAGFVSQINTKIFNNKENYQQKSQKEFTPER